MVSIPHNSTASPTLENSISKDLQFDWLARAGQISGMALVVVDHSLNVQFYDPKVLRLLELNVSDDYTKRNMLEIVELLAKRGDFGPGDSGIFIDLVVNEISKTMENQVVGADFQPQPFNFITPSGRRIEFRMDPAHPDFFILGCHDITEKLVERHALKVAMESSHSGFLIYETDKREFRATHSEFSNGFSSILGKEITIQNLKQHIHPVDYRKMRSRANEAHMKKENWSATIRVKNALGETIWIKAQATPQIAESGLITSYIIFYTEVTAQLRIQDDLRKATEQVQKALNAKNAFLGRLSHEIRTPMNAVVGIADALIHHHGDPEITPKLELIQSSADKIVRIVDESLEHTKLAEAKVQLNPQMSSPRATVESVCALWKQKAIENDINLLCRIDKSVPEKMSFDAFRYEQCLNNLLSNAVKFSPSGNVHVVLTTLEKQGRNNLIVVVKDNGIGMNELQLANLFEAYTQADNTISGRFGGTGLGMNITKQLIELMGGHITAKSELGRGTTIALTLPIEIERTALESDDDASDLLVSKILLEAAPEQSEYSDLRVLVVDDNSTNHMVVSSLLGTLVKEIGVAENGVEAIEALDAAQAANLQYDFVLMDIHMPIMDGIEATLSIRSSDKDYANIPIIALTADPQYQQKRLCKNIGMDEALAKPVKLTEVLEAIDKVFSVRQTSTLAA